MINKLIKGIKKILDIALFVYFILLLIIVGGGGFSLSVFGVRLQAHDTENPALTFAVLLILRIIVNYHRRIDEIPVIRLLSIAVNTAKQWIKIRPAILVSVLVGLYALGMGTITVIKHLSYHSHAFDLGIFDQVIWTTLHGDMLYSSILGGRHFFGEHFSPILLLLTPLYWGYANPITLLFFQSIALAVGTIPIYLLAEKKLESHQLALFFSLLYVCYQPLRNVNLFDFHPVALTTPFLLFAFFYLEQKKYLPFCVFLFLALSCKEEISLIVFIFGIYIAFVQKKKMFGGVLSLLGILVFFLDIGVIIPYYRQAPFAFVDRYTYLGSSIPEMIKTFIFHPIYVLKHVLIAKKVKYTAELFGPVGFLSVFSPSHLLLVLPTFLQNILSDAKPQYSIGYQYTAPLTPFIFISAIYGLQNILRKSNLQERLKLHYSKPQLIHGFSVLFLLLCLLFFGKSPIYYLRKYRITEHTKTTDKLLNIIPSTASVSAQDTLVPHLSRRRNIYQFPVVHEAEFIVLDSTSSKWPLSQEEYCTRISELLSGSYGVMATEDNIILFKKGYLNTNDKDVSNQLCKDCKTIECN